MLKMTEADFESVLKVNLTGAFNMTQSVLKPMTRARQGAIINLSSVVVLTRKCRSSKLCSFKSWFDWFYKISCA